MRLVGLAAALKPYLIVFTASACTLIIEIVAGRILAPVIGVSLFTWTSIIGIVLAGISAGNYLGGRIADRFPWPTTLGIILLAGGISSIGIVPLVDLVAGVFADLPIIPRIVLLTTVLFLLPSLILGMVTPVVIKLQLRDLSRTGNVVGQIYAVSTAGSILGTFITGFVLIQWMGTRAILLSVSIVLVVMALAFGSLLRRPRAAMATALLAMAGLYVAVMAYSLVGHKLTSTCLRESSYFCIKVREEERDDGLTVRTLILDSLVQGYAVLEDPSVLIYSYQKVFGDLAFYVGQRRPDMRVLFIGGGSYTLPRYLELAYPESSLEVVEIDPEVTEVAYDYLGLWRDTRIVTYNEDARTKLQELRPASYDLIIGDAFNDVSVPYHLTTLEFNEMVRSLLREDGIYAVNVVDKLYSGGFLRAFVNTMRRTFPYVYVMRDNDRWQSDDRYTYVVVGSMRPLEQEAIEEANRDFGREPTLRFMPRGAFDQWLNGRRALLLTDDYVPVDNLLAPLYLESR